MVRTIAGKKLSDMGIGTWKMGGGESPSTTHDESDVEMIELALDRGINVIDTAEMYGAGHSEELVGKAIVGRDREKLFIITKVLPAHLSHDKLIRAATQSLRRLGTDYIDLYLIHWPPAKLELIKEGIAAMEELVRDGLVKAIGVSNFDVPEMRYAIGTTRGSKIAANQIEYSLAEMGPEREVIPFCEKNGIEVIAYTPIADGRVADIKRVQEVAKRTDHTPIQVAVNYLFKRSIPIPKASREKHMLELLGSVGWELSAKDYAYLRD